MTAARGSLEGRLIRRLSVTLAGTVLLFATVYLVLANDAGYHAVEETGETIQTLVPAIRKLPDGSFAFDREAARRAIGNTDGARFAAVDNNTGAVVAGSDPEIVPYLKRKLPAERFTSKLIDEGGGVRVIHSERLADGNHVWRVALSWPMTHAQIVAIGLKHEFLEELIPGVLPALLLAIAVSWITIRLNLRPLRRASAEARAVSVDHPGQRMTSDGMADELTPLIDAVNRALGHLEDALANQKRFMANAAHELRTPLSVLRARVEGLAIGEERAVLARDIDRISRAVSQLLLTARLQSKQAGETERIDLARFVRGLVADMAPLAHARKRDIALRIEGHPCIEGSSTGIESAVRNLIDNALRYTPVNTAVLVGVGPEPRIIVEDCGPGIPQALRDKVFEPFFRGHERAGDGAGLGLAIVREVAALHGGSVHVDASPAGGARFTLMLAEAESGGTGSVRQSETLRLPAQSKRAELASRPA